MTQKCVVLMGVKMTDNKRKKSKNKDLTTYKRKTKKKSKSSKLKKKVKTKDVKKPKPRHPNKLSINQLKQKTDKFEMNYYTAVTKILEEDGIDWEQAKFTTYVLQMLMVDRCLYNETTSPFFHEFTQQLFKHPSEFQRIYEDEIYGDGGEEEISTYINRQYLLRAISEYVSGSGGGKLKSKLQKLSSNWRENKYE
jgi:hypothetical protein